MSDRNYIQQTKRAGRPPALASPAGGSPSLLCWWCWGVHGPADDRGGREHLVRLDDGALHGGKLDTRTNGHADRGQEHVSASLPTHAPRPPPQQQQQHYSNAARSRAEEETPPHSARATRRWWAHTLDVPSWSEERRGGQERTGRMRKGERKSGGDASRITS